MTIVPIALTPIMMKCFERLVMHHIKSSLPNTLDPFQFAYRPNRSTDHAISTTLHLALTHLEQKDSYVRMLFIDFSSAFNTIISQQLIHKLNLLGLNTSLCNWILDFLTARPQSVRVSRNTSSTEHRCLNGVVLTTCPSMWVRQKRLWWTSGETLLTTPHWPSTAQPWRFLGVHITEDLTWTTNVTSLNKKGQQCLHFLRRLKRASLPPPILTTFYIGTIESVLTSCITVWYGNCSAADRKTLQRTVNTAAKIIGVPLPSILDIFLARCSSKASSIVKDPTHPSHNLFQLLPSGIRYRSIKARSVRLLNSFFPQAVRALNSNLPVPLWNHEHISPLPPTH